MAFMVLSVPLIHPRIVLQSGLTHRGLTLSYTTMQLIARIRILYCFELCFIGLHVSIQHQIAARFIASQRKSVEAVPAHVTETGTTSLKIPLPAPSSPVESQQSSVSQGAQLHSPSSSSEPEETVVYTGEACSHVSQNGISFHFPASESKCRVELRFKVVNDDYVLPEGMKTCH